jgi:hypothetical protein
MRCYYSKSGEPVKHLFIYFYLFLEQKSIREGAVRRLGYKATARATPHVYHLRKTTKHKGVTKRLAQTIPPHPPT